MGAILKLSDDANLDKTTLYELKNKIAIQNLVEAIDKIEDLIGEDEFWISFNDYQNVLALISRISCVT